MSAGVPSVADPVAGVVPLAVDAGTAVVPSAADPVTAVVPSAVDPVSAMVPLAAAPVTGAAPSAVDPVSAAASLAVDPVSAVVPFAVDPVTAVVPSAVDPVTAAVPFAAADPVTALVPLAVDGPWSWVVDQLHTLMSVCDTAVIVYFLAINSCYLVLILIAVGEFVRRQRRTAFAGYDDAAVSPFTPPVSVIMPAYNEAGSIAEAVRAMLLLRYPVFEVIVVDDGSTDGTLEALTEAFDLAKVEHVVTYDIPNRGRILSVYLPRGGPVPLVVARKENGKGKADALNAGINLARYPLVCLVDADCILDSQALLTVAEPFGDDPMRVVGTGGVVGIANGCTIVAGRVVDPHVPSDLLGRIQVVEYLRAFFLGRTGWSKIGGLLIIAGAFGLFRKDVLVASGGLDADCIGEDAELVIRLHRDLRRQGRDYRIGFVTEPISWTEAPSTLKDLASQRRRWHRGLTEIMIKHRRMIGNPRYGVVGTLALPFFLFFELLAPVIELSGLILVPLSVLMGAVDVAFLWKFMLAAYAYSAVIGLISVAVEEWAFHRFTHWRDVWGTVVGVIAENFGYRQLTAWWRIQGMWDGLRKTESQWVKLTRTGFDAPGGDAGAASPAADVRAGEVTEGGGDRT